MLRVKLHSELDIKEYSQFYDYEEFKVNMEIWLIDYQKRFTRGEVIGLNQLLKLASSVPGVCHEAMRKIVCCPFSGWNEHTISRSTFKRMVWKCIKIGMLNVYESKYSNGAQGGNLYVFNRYPAWNEGSPSKNWDNEHYNLSHSKTV